MSERRYEFRKPCTDSVEVEWQDQKGRARKGLGNLEDISLTGACVHMAHPVSFGTRLLLMYQSRQFRGKVGTEQFAIRAVAHTGKPVGDV